MPTTNINLTIDKTTVGLGSVDNTADLSKPISTATQNALNAKVSLTGAETITNKVAITSKAITTGGDGTGAGTGGYLDLVGQTDNPNSPTNSLRMYSNTNGGNYTIILEAPSKPVNYLNFFLHPTVGRQWDFPDANGKILTTGNLTDITAVGISLPLTGTPTAPTAAPGTNTTQIANTAFVTAAITAAGGNLKADGTVPLTANWAAGNFSITANSVILGSAANTTSGGSASAGNYTIQSTTHATKGFTSIGSTTTFTVDEVNKRIGIGVAAPAEPLHVQKDQSGTTSIKVHNATSNGICRFLASGNSNAFGFGVYGSTATPYGAIAANDGFAYSGSSFTFMSEAASGAGIKFAVGTSTPTEIFRFNSSGDMVPAEGKNLIAGTTTGWKCGTATGQKIAWWGATPVVQQVLATGAGATVDNVITLLQTLGLCKQS